MTTQDPFDVSGRVGIVTGGAGMLGKQHAAALLDRGAVVLLADVDVARAEAAARILGRGLAKDRVIPVRLDVTSKPEVTDACSAVIDSHGRVDILINNAAVDPKVRSGDSVATGRLEAFSEEQWQLELDVGLKGAFLCSQVFGGWMAANGGGVILNIASDLSVFSPDQRIYRRLGLPDDQQPAKPVTYSVIKTGLVGLTRYLATYWADRGVRVNALSPGGVYVDQPEEFVSKLRNLIPLGRMAREDEYRAAVQFLCSDASSYMTGQNIVMDGGRSVW